MPTACENDTVFEELGERLLAGGLDEPERRHLLALWRELRPAASPATRKALVARLLDHPEPPADLLLAAAEDDPEIAGPLLRDAPFRPEELIGLITRTGTAHHMEIARRADLTLDVWLALARAATERGGLPGAADRGDASRAQEPAPAPRRPRTGAPASQDREQRHPRGGGETGSWRAAVLRDEPVKEERRDAPRPPADPPQGTGRDPLIVTADRPWPRWRVLDDPSGDSWAFETDRQGVIVGISPLAETAFGRPLEALGGRGLRELLADHAAAPTPDWVGEALRTHRPIRDAIAEIRPADAAPARRWRIRARPRFSFPEGRFLGLAGTARDLDRLPARAGHSVPELLERMADAAERLARSTDDPRLEDYATSLAELARSLKTAIAAGPQATEHPRHPR